MDRWRSQVPFTSGNLFNQRLAADGLTDEMLLRIMNLRNPEELVPLLCLNG